MREFAAKHEALVTSIIFVFVVAIAILGIFTPKALMAAMVVGVLGFVLLVIWLCCREFVRWFAS